MLHAQYDMATFLLIKPAKRLLGDNFDLRAYMLAV